MIPEDAITEEWEHGGLRCRIAKGFSSMCGYVQIPEDWREHRKVFYNDLPLEVHGGLTYGMDDDGWIGFDTGHAFDTWLDPEVGEFEHNLTLKKLGIEPVVEALLMSGTDRADWVCIWTLDKLRVEVEHLADQLGIFMKVDDDFQSPYSAEEAWERTRWTLRRAHELTEQMAAENERPPDEAWKDMAEAWEQATEECDAFFLLKAAEPDGEGDGSAA